MSAAKSPSEKPINIEQRLDFMQLGEDGRKKLRELRPVLERELPKALSPRRWSELRRSRAPLTGRGADRGPRAASRTALPSVSRVRW